MTDDNDQVIKRLREVQLSVPVYMTGTVTSNNSLPMQVTIDSDPSRTSVTPNANLVGALPEGTRVALLKQAPSLLVVIGALGGTDLTQFNNAAYMLVYDLDTMTYPARPAGVAAGHVTYKGPAEPTDAITPDTWEDTTGVWP